MRPSTFAVITGPASEPISLATAKAHLRVEVDDDNTYITALITAAREVAEISTKRSLISQTLEAKYTGWPESGEGIWLPRPPLTSVTGIYYYDTNGTEQTLSSSAYTVETAHAPGLVSLKPSNAWPGLESGRAIPVRVRYVAGYADAASVPAGITQGMLMLIAIWYEQRKSITPGTMSQIPWGAEMLFSMNACEWGW
jgi:uncharacterized phiE125 gp8 family phage protein